jgi:hypothetical protein
MQWTHHSPFTLELSEGTALIPMQRKASSEGIFRSKYLKITKSLHRHVQYVCAVLEKGKGHRKF